MSKYSGRQYPIQIIFISVAVIFFIRLCFLQVFDNSYKLSADNNVLRYVTDYPARGNLFDRHNKLMVYNEAAYDLMVIPKQVGKIDTLDLCKVLEITKENFDAKLLAAFRHSPYTASVFEKQISSNTYANLQEKLYKYNGFFVQPRILRKYPFNMAAHVLGDIGEVDKRIITRDSSYVQGDYIGMSGIEKAYEKYLRGIKGKRIVMVDNFNREKGDYKEGKFNIKAVAGYDLVTSLDFKLQAYGEQLMQHKIGSIVAIEPSTGEILALISAPSYDPNLLVGRDRAKNYNILLHDSIIPLINRAIQGTYPPGSTFKLLNALIGLNEEAIRTDTRFSCSKGFHAGNLTVGCHAHASPQDLYGGIQISCNSYFCNTFRAIIDNPKYKTTTESYSHWRKHVTSFGCGKTLMIDLPEEKKGFIPLPDYYNKIYGKDHWRALTVISLAIGQGEVLITPMQMANVTACIANRGFYYIPHIVKKIGDKKMTDSKYTTRMYSTINQKNFIPIIEGMEMVVKAGTARIAQLDTITVCGKTGTAQNPHGEDHSIFTAFAPKNNPKIAIAVIVENGGFGAAWAAPIASLMLEKYLTDTIKRVALEEKMMNGNLMHNRGKKKNEKSKHH